MGESSIWASSHSSRLEYALRGNGESHGDVAAVSISPYDESEVRRDEDVLLNALLASELRLDDESDEGREAGGDAEVCVDADADTRAPRFELAEPEPVTLSSAASSSRPEETSLDADANEAGLLADGRLLLSAELSMLPLPLLLRFDDDVDDVLVLSDALALDLDLDGVGFCGAGS